MKRFKNQLHNKKYWMGKRVLDLKEKKEKSKLPVFFAALISMFLLIAVIAVVTKDKDLGFLKPVPEKEEKKEELPTKEVELSKDMSYFFEISKNRNKALNLPQDSNYSYPGVPSELNEYPVYATCDGKIMPNNNNPFSTYSWALLAYSSLYKSTKDESYIPILKETEKKLIEVHGVMKAEKTYYLKTIIMFHYIISSYDLLRGSNIFEHEQKIKDLMISDVIAFAKSPYVDFTPVLENAQDTAMFSASMSKVVGLMGENIAKSEREAVIKTSEEHYRRSLEISENEIPEGYPKQLCWVSLAEYNLNKITNLNTGINKNVLSTVKDVNEGKEIFAPATVQPCIELLLSVYKDTNDEKYLNSASELNTKLLEKSLVQDETCIIKSGIKALESFADKDALYFSDQSYEMYLLALLNEVG